MKAPFYLIVTKTGTIRTTKNQPNLNWDEISIKMNLELPDSLFKKPLLSADIIVNESQVSPTVISPEVINNIEKSINENAGVEVRLTLVDETEKTL